MQHSLGDLRGRRGGKTFTGKYIGLFVLYIVLIQRSYQHKPYMNNIHWMALEADTPALSVTVSLVDTLPLDFQLIVCRSIFHVSYLVACLRG